VTTARLCPTSPPVTTRVEGERWEGPREPAAVGTPVSPQIGDKGVREGLREKSVRSSVHR
jgi:hypothetical protein